MLLLWDIIVKGNLVIIFFLIIFFTNWHIESLKLSFTALKVDQVKIGLTFAWKSWSNVLSVITKAIANYVQ